MRIPVALFFLIAAATHCLPAYAVDPLQFGDENIKCGTPQIMESFRLRGKAAATRPSRAVSVLSSAGHFRVHYDTTGFNAPDTTDLDLNGIPEYIDSTLTYLEYAWDVQVTELGYRPPKSDNGVGGGDEIDIYIQNYGSMGFYGATYPDQEEDGTSSAYVVLDNDYSESQYASRGLDGLKVTSAHEFFHVIHFAYRRYADLPVWWMEESAVWMEDRCWSEVNDYLNYLYYFFHYSYYPIDYNTGNFKYGAVVWPMYLAKRFGDDLIRQIWETFATAPVPGISSFDAVIPIGLGSALNEFGTWNYFTSDRANTTNFYSDGDSFPYTVSTDLEESVHPVSDSLDIGHLSSGYVEFLFIGDWGDGDALKVDFSADSGLSHENSLIFYNTPYDFRIVKLEYSGVTVSLGKTWNRAILVTTCTNIASADGIFRFNAVWSDETGVAELPVQAFTITGVNPNPFNPATTIHFSLPAQGKVSVRAYNIAGQKVADIFEGVLSAGEKNIMWKPSGLSGGVYFITVTSPHGSRAVKVLLLK